MVRSTELAPHRPRRQAGDALLESIVAMVLLGVIGLGLVYAMGRATVAQKVHKGQSLAVQGIRADLQSSGVPSGCPAAGSASVTKDLALSSTVTLTGVTKTCNVGAITVTVNGVAKSVTLPSIRYEVSAATLLGPGTLVVSN